MSNNTPGIAAYANFIVTTFLFFDAKLIISNNCESYITHITISFEITTVGFFFVCFFYNIVPEHFTSHFVSVEDIFTLLQRNSCIKCRVFDSFCSCSCGVPVRLCVYKYINSNILSFIKGF